LYEPSFLTFFLFPFFFGFQNSSYSHASVPAC